MSEQDRHTGHADHGLFGACRNLETLGEAAGNIHLIGRFSMLGILTISICEITMNIG